MQQPPTSENGEVALESGVATSVAAARLAIGLLQGLFLYYLYLAAKSDSWPATERFAFAPALLAGAIVPVILISSLGHLTPRRLGQWALISAGIIAALGFYDVWRIDPAASSWRRAAGDTLQVHTPSPLLFVFLIGGFFIAHSLILSAAHDRRRIARYSTHFETAWKMLIQLSFSTFFVGALWAALWLGSALFMLIDLDFLKRLLQESWFAIPVTAFAFSCAIHLTDIRPAIVRGIRALLLMLLSWILPITTLIVCGFLASLPWTGLTPLWATRSATTVLLGTAATLVVLINAAFQDGHAPAGVSRAIRLSTSLAAVSLLPITAIAIYSLGLRVMEYGWTTDRIIAAACILVASLYAAGYAWAASARTGWMDRVAPVNLVAAYAILAILLALFSPIADPARIAVNSQVTRLLSGRIEVEKFDFEYLRFHGGRYGMNALARLRDLQENSQAAQIREKAQLAIERQFPTAHADRRIAATDISGNIDVWPKHTRLPVSFSTQNWAADARPWEVPSCLVQAGKKCDAYVLDISGDGKPEILLLSADYPMGAKVMMEDKDGHWASLGELPGELFTCASLREKLLAGDYRLVPPRLKDFEIDGLRIEVQRRDVAPIRKCPQTQK